MRVDWRVSGAIYTSQTIMHSHTKLFLVPSAECFSCFFFCVCVSLFYPCYCWCIYSIIYGCIYSIIYDAFKLMQSVSSTSALCTLIESALEKRHVMPQVSSWLSSPLLRSRLQDLVTMVTTKHSTMPPLELEQGLRVICLVLSANDDNGEKFAV